MNSQSEMDEREELSSLAYLTQGVVYIMGGKKCMSLCFPEDWG